MMAGTGASFSNPTEAVPVVEPVSVDDNGGSITVDGSVAVSNFPAVQPVNDNGGSLTVDGDLNVTVTDSACSDSEFLNLIDCSGIRFLRRVDTACDGTVVITDTELDGVTAFAACDPIRFAGEGSLQSGAGGPAVITRVVQAANYTTSAAARRVTIIWTGNAASVGNRVALQINAGAFIPLVNSVGTIIFGDLSSPDSMGYTITVDVNQASDDVTVVEEF